MESQHHARLAQFLPALLVLLQLRYLQYSNDRPGQQLRAKAQIRLSRRAGQDVPTQLAALRNRAEGAWRARVADATCTRPVRHGRAQVLRGELGRHGLDPVWGPGVV